MEREKGYIFKSWGKYTIPKVRRWEEDGETRRRGEGFKERRNNDW